MFELKKIKLLFVTVFILFLSFSFIKILNYHTKMITYPFQLEFREGAMLVTTDLLIKGKRPFTWDVQPEHTNTYGIAYHFITYPFAKLFSSNLLVHRAVSGFFVICSCLLLFFIIHRHKIPLYYSYGASLLFYCFLLFPGTTTPFAGPHSMGLFLFLCCIFIPWIKNYSTKSLIVSGFCGILAFYTKPYFILALPFLTCYLFLFTSKKKGLLFGISWSILFLISIFIIKNIFNCYFTNIFFINFNGAQNSLSHCLKQFSEFIRLNRETIIILLLGLSLWGIEKIKQIKNSENIFSKFNWKKLSEPLIQKSFNLILFCLLFSTIFIYFKLGRHGGSWMAYLFHIITPFFLVLVVTCLKNYRWKDFILIPLIVMNLINIMPKSLEIRSQDSLKNWDKIQNIVSKYKRVHNSPAIVSLLLEQNKSIYDSGLSECFSYYSKAKNPFLKNFFLEGEDYSVQINEEFRENIRYKIKNKFFDLIVLTKNWAVMLPKETKMYYQYKGSITVDMPYSNMSWELALWIPK